MRLVMVGTGPFAVPTFGQLYETQHSVVALVTGPLHPRRGKGRVPVGPLRQIAAQYGTPIFDPQDINQKDSRGRLSAYQADLLVVCDYGQILSAATLATTRIGGINLHGSLLPKYRGAAPIQWAVYHGEAETGVSIIHMTPQLDAGPVIAQDRTAVDADETAEQLEVRLSEMGAPLVARALDRLESGGIEPLPQDPSLASKAPRLDKSDGLIDWSRSAVAVKNQIRAVQPWPKAFTFWHRPDGGPLRLIVAPVDLADSALTGPAPGTVLAAEWGQLTVATGDGAVSLTGLQPAGKRPLPVDQFLRGYHVQSGQKFGSS